MKKNTLSKYEDGNRKSTADNMLNDNTWKLKYM